MPSAREQFVIDVLNAAELDWTEKKDQVEKDLIKDGFEGVQLLKVLQIIRDSHMNAAYSYLSGVKDGHNFSAECVKHAANLYKDTSPKVTVYRLLEIISEELVNA